MCICDPLTGRVCALHQDLLRRVRAEGFDVTARPAGWVPLAEVLAALRDRSGLADWLEGKGRFVWPDGPTLDIAGTYLADRFGAKEGTDGSVPA